MTLDAPTQPTSTMRRDIVSAYVASGAKVLSWAAVTAIVFRYGREENLAILTLARATLGLLTFTTLGFAPAMIRLIAEASRIRAASDEDQPPVQDSGVLDYARAVRRSGPTYRPADTVYANGLLLAVILSLIGGVLLVVYVANYDVLHRTPEIPRLWVIQDFIVAMGLGTLARLLSDAPGARLQASGYIWLDNLLLGGGDVLWALLTWIGRGNYDFVLSESIKLPGDTFFWSGICVLVARVTAAAFIEGLRYRPVLIRWTIMRALLSFGVLVSLAQLADFLYAPVDYILINHLLDPTLGTVYAPAVQLDAALLILVTALGNVLLPKTAVAHVRGDTSLIRRYYLRGTMASLLVLTIAAVCVWLLSTWIFRLWLGDPMPATQAILPLVLIHTIVGGSSAVGRSILLGMGKVKPFTIAVLIAGASNVILSYCFVRYGGLGLNGIVLGTICAVVGRCAIWQPWYVWRSLKSPTV